MGRINILRAVLFKNFTIRIHHWMLTIFQVVLPVVLFATTAIIVTKVDGFEKKYIQNVSFGSHFSSEQLYNDQFNHETKIYYTPSTWFSTELMYQVQLKFSLNSEAISVYDSEEEMMNGIDYDSEAVLAVIFNFDSGEIPKDLNYTIRPYEKYVNWQTGILYNSGESYIPDQGSEMYVNRGLLAFQMALESSYIEMVSNRSLPIAINVEEFPYPPHIDDSALKNVIIYFFPVITVLSFTLLCPIIICSVMEDKVTGMKELMRVMGLKSGMMWFTWFLDMFCWNLISLVLITAILVYLKSESHPPLLEHCSFSVLLMFFSLYTSALITFCFALSSFFDKPIHAITTTILVWIIAFFIPQRWMNGDPSFFQRIIMIFPNAGLIFGYKIISDYETRELGVQWTNIFQSPSWQNNEFTMGTIFACFIVQCLVYITITLYMSEIKPGFYGRAQVWYFPLLWFRRQIKQIECDPQPNIFSPYIEEINFPVSVKVRNLCKCFGNEKVVDNLCMDIYEQQITVLLGKNGAGKTTTLSMIAGILSLTSGSISINDICNTNNFVSICPQSNLQFHALTVLHHLRFYGILKGLSGDEALREADHIIVLTNLSSKKNCLPSELSTGMQRRLSISVAVIGSNNVVILDEPTAGLDPESRRDIWDILIGLRGYRTIIVTTHSMEEAEVLGDRIAIMDRGVLKSYGTPIFLRNKLGAGSYITVKLKKCSDVEPLVSAVKENPNLKCKVKTERDEITICASSSTNNEIRDTVKWLEDSQNFYNIENIGLTKMTMEDLFLKASTLGFNYQPPPSDEKPTGFKKMKEINTWSQFKILFFKWLKFTRKKLQFIQIVVMILCMVICLFGSENLQEASEPDTAVQLSLQTYQDSAVFIGNSQNGMFSKIADYYEDLLNGSVLYSKRVQNLSDEIIQKGIQNIEFYKKRMVIAVSFDDFIGKNSATAFYSNKAVHGAPISLNLLTNAVLKSLNGPDYGIKVENHPLPSLHQHRIQHLSMIQVLLIWYIFLPLGALLLVGISIFCPYAEYASKIMHLQQMCGISKWLYWSSCYVKDVVVYFISIGIVIGITYAFNAYFTMSSIFGGAEMGILFVMLAAFGVSAIPHSYLFIYRSSGFVGYGLFIITSLLISNTIVIGVFYMEFSEDEELKAIANSINYFFVLFPTFGLKYAMMKLIKQSVWNHNWRLRSPEHKQTICATNYNPCCCGDNSDGCIRYQSYLFGQNAVATAVFEMLASSALYFLILYILETNSFTNGYSKVKKILKRNEKEDETEKSEEEVLTRQSDGSLNANIKSKKIGSQVVLNDIKFEIEPKQCVGLLGVNGAGKSTTFRLLAGEDHLKNGEISLHANEKRVSINENKLEYLQNIGYCPQFDELSELISGRALLRLFAGLRGIESVEEEVNKFLDIFGLTNYADQLCNTYSIGCKRKLFTALALIGMPPFILLDEPTAGVDLTSRRKLWDALILTKNSDSSIILSTHNMDECEILCENIVTLKSGKIIFKGPISSLKSRYNDSCIITLKLAPMIHIPPQKSSKITNQKFQLCDNVEQKWMSDLKVVIENEFTDHELLDQHPALLKYRVKRNGKTLSEIFRIVEEIQRICYEKLEDYIVEDFDISEVTLEALFLCINSKEGA